MVIGKNIRNESYLKFEEDTAIRYIKLAVNSLLITYFKYSLENAGIPYVLLIANKNIVALQYFAIGPFINKIE